MLASRPITVMAEPYAKPAQAGGANARAAYARLCSYRALRDLDARSLLDRLLGLIGHRYFTALDASARHSNYRAPVAYTSAGPGLSYRSRLEKPGDLQEGLGSDCFSALVLVGAV